jgi:hypothetical protein
VQNEPRTTEPPAHFRLWMEYLAVLAAAGILYVATVAPGPLWQDNGMAQVRVLEHDYVGQLGLALAHPLFYLIAQAFQWLPFSESAFKTNLVSAVCAALTVANIYLLLSLLLAGSRRRRAAAIIGAVSLLLAHTFWQHAALAEVYSVSTFVLTCELLAIVQFSRTGQIGWWLATWLLNGIECSNHVLAIITLAVIGGWSAYLFYTGRIRLYWVVPALAVWLVGCLPYEYLGYQSWRSGQSVGSVVHSMLFGKYQSQVLNARLSARLLVSAVLVLGLNFPTPNLLLIPAGLGTGRTRLPDGLYHILLAATVLHLAFAMRYPVRDQYTFFIIPVLFLAVWLGLGAAWALERGAPSLRAVLIAFALIPPVVYALVPRVRAAQRYVARITFPPIPYRDEATFFFHPWKTGYCGADRLVQEVFSGAPSGGIILADSTSSRPFVYSRRTNRMPAAWTVVEDLYSDLPVEKKIRALARELQTRTVIIIRPYPGYCPNWILTHFKIVPWGPVYRVAGPKPAGEPP